jgi:HAE1 family hydrophobic/amphiphilic exporter-1
LVNIGGLITSTILCLIVLPGYYKIMSGGKALREDPFADID